MKNFQIDAKLLAQVFGPNDKNEPTTLAKVGELRHPRYGKFDVGVTQGNQRSIAIVHSSGRIALIHFEPLLPDVIDQLMKEGMT